ncbi:MAG TPA: hypothetical protein VM366_03670 [Anaerolineae bacterium]|nr:hypothetical protein [Anaerolineae bacterium]
MNELFGTDVMAHMQSGASRALLNPPGAVWHHPWDDPEIVQLLMRTEHVAPELQSILHPGRLGGYVRHYGPQ